MKYHCTACSTPSAYLLAGGLCPACFVPAPVADLPKEKASFTININRRRAVIRWRKRGLRPPKTKKQTEQMLRNKAASTARWEAANRDRRKEYFKARYQYKKESK